VTYKGKYRPTNVSKYKGDPTNVIYRSGWERYCFSWLDNNPNIKEWSSEEVVVPYYYDVDKKIHRYYVDLKFTTNEGRTFIIEIKPAKETAPPKRPDKTKRYISEALTYVKNQNKWEAATRYAKDRNWTFEIWTEKTLTDMGIMPKQSDKALKPLKPLKPFRKAVKKKIIK
jgi:hypothetical protein